jgi:hypothetical protein
LLPLWTHYPRLSLWHQMVFVGGFAWFWHNYELLWSLQLCHNFTWIGSLKTLRKVRVSLEVCVLLDMFLVQHFPSVVTHNFLWKVGCIKNLFTRAGFISAASFLALHSKKMDYSVPN